MTRYPIRLSAFAHYPRLASLAAVLLMAPGYLLSVGPGTAEKAAQNGALASTPDPTPGPGPNRRSWGLPGPFLALPDGPRGPVSLP